jgi:outer membrane receptor protein involved in Fe transport
LLSTITDGASALYGSDAVGGVANIILRRDFQGIETTARVGGSTDGGDLQQQYSVVGGGRWSSGGFMVAVNYDRTTPIYASQRDYTRTLDPSLTLTLQNRQLSGVLSGHQRLTSGVELEIDGYVSDRNSYKQTPFLPSQSVFQNGLVTRPELRSYALTPTLRFQLPAGWEATLSATRALSHTSIDSRNYVNGNLIPAFANYRNKTTALEGGLEGPLFALPGGDARLAVGGGTRQIGLDTDVEQTSGGRTVSLRKYNDSRNVLFAYGELSLPLVGPSSNVPLIHRLSLSTALRYERYRNLDQVATPKLGFVYDPTPDATIRGSWGKSFKAPTLDQVNQVLQGALLPAAIFAPQPTPPLAAGATVLLLGGGSPGLRAERATTWTATFELHPRLIDGLRLEASYFHINYRDRIASAITGTLSALANPIFHDLIVFNPTAAQVNALIATFPLGLSNQTGKPFDPASVGAIIDGALRNTARVRAEGVDLTADYRIDLAPGNRLLLTAAASYLESDRQLTPDQPILVMAGTIFNPPHWRGRAGATWEGPRTSLAAFVNYVGGTSDNRFANTQGPAPFVTLDLTAAWHSGATRGPLGGVELRVSALNLLNEKPSLIRNSDPSAPSYDSTNQSPVGRFLGISLRKLW